MARLLTRGMTPEQLAQDSAAPGAARSAPAAEGLPPLVTRGEHTDDPAPIELVLADGTVKFVMPRTGRDGRVGFIDWINFTFHESTAHNLEWGSLISDDAIVRAISYKLDEIFGFGITSQCEKGRNFYQRAYELGEGLGFVCHGGQRNSVLVMLSGTGIAAATEGWETRLHDFLTNVAIRPRITRCDVAHDVFQAEYTPERALEDYRAGLYRLPKSPVTPDCEMRGNWEFENGKGRSFYVGHRTSGKYLRVYEKGKQLGAPSSEWVRVEVEYKAADRIIPFDILLEPGAYLAGAYPALEWINDHQERIKTIRRTVECSKEQKESWIHNVAGKDIAVLHLIEDGETEEERALNLVRRLSNHRTFPAWATLPEYLRGSGYIHAELVEGPSDFGPDGHAAILADFERELQSCK